MGQNESKTRSPVQILEESYVCSRDYLFRPVLTMFVINIRFAMQLYRAGLLTGT